MQDKTTPDREKPPTEAKSHIAQEIEAMGAADWLEQFRAVYGSSKPAHESQERRRSNREKLRAAVAALPDGPQKRFMQEPPLEPFLVNALADKEPA